MRSPTVSFSLPDDDHRRLVRMCADTKVSMSSFVRKAVRVLMQLGPENHRDLDLITSSGIAGMALWKTLEQLRVDELEKRSARIRKARGMMDKGRP